MICCTGKMWSKATAAQRQVIRNIESGRLGQRQLAFIAREGKGAVVRQAAAYANKARGKSARSKRRGR